jgi:hypothetical protein
MRANSKALDDRERAVALHRALKRGADSHGNFPGTSTAGHSRMPQHTGRTSNSYDDITRNTVPEPDSSFRPTKDQERAAFEGERILSSDETDLHNKVADALRSSGLALSEVSFEIDGTKVTLRGRVDDHHLLPQLEGVVRAVPDIGDIVDLVVVDPRT